MAGTSAPPRSAAPSGATDTLIDEPSGHSRMVDVGVVGAIGVAFVITLVLVSSIAGSGWFGGHSSPSTGEITEPMRQADDWLVANIGDDNHLIIDAAAADDLASRGLSGQRIAAVPATGPIPETLAGWREFDYFVSSPTVRDQFSQLPSVQAVVESSWPVAVFGADDERVEIRRIDPAGSAHLYLQGEASRSLRWRAGSALGGNPNVTASGDALDAMWSGQVDERLLNVLATLSVQHHLSIGEFPMVGGEAEAGTPRRIVELDSIDFELVADRSQTVDSIRTFLAWQLDEYRPVNVTVEDRSGGTTLRITYAVAGPNP